MSKTFNKGDRVTAGAAHGGVWQNLVVTQPTKYAPYVFVRREPGGQIGAFMPNELDLIESKIDWTKPIEYVDGSPAKYLRKDGPHFVVTPRNAPGSTSGNFYREDGRHAYGVHMPVRNKAEATALDLSKPLEYSDGTPVVLVRVTKNGDIHVRATSSAGTMRGVRCFKSDGTRKPGMSHSHITLRNRAEPKETTMSMLNTYKSFQTVGGRSARLCSQFYSSDMNKRYLFEITNAPRPIYVVTDVFGKVRPGSPAVDADDIMNVPERTSVFKNVYAEGDTGTSEHKTLETAKFAAKVGKTRIGILEISKVDGAVVSTKLHACKPSVRKDGFSAAEFVAA